MQQSPVPHLKSFSAWQLLFDRFDSWFLKFAEDVQEKLAMVDEYVNHLKDVQRDRSLECLLQTETLEAGGNSRAVLLVQTDGMDQAKWSLPRQGGPRPSKKTASVVRQLR